MDLEQLKYLTDEQKERYMKMSRLFDSPGWDVLEKWAKINADEARDRAASASSWEENRIAVGMRIVYDTLAKLPEINEAEYAAIAQDASEAQLEDNELDYE